jgi:hypothetical protein
MKVEKYAEHLATVIRHEVETGQYQTAQILASNLAEILQGITETQEKKSDATIRALSYGREVTA